jgi:hypothetical protein
VNGRDGTPVNVRVVVDDREYPCDVRRAPEQDTPGAAAWVAVPRGPFPLLLPGSRVSLRVDILPAHTKLLAQLPATPGLSMS